MIVNTTTAKSVTPKLQETHYDSTFFRSITPGAQESAEAMVSEILRLIQPNSVIDVGCGLGVWCAEFIKRGITDVMGVDGDYVPVKMLEIQASKFFRHDLEQPLAVGRTFDLAVCLEVGEHLSPERSKELVSDLAKLAPIVLFSAAIPNQGGTNHINEQWPEYWATLFAAHRFTPFDLRPMLWHNERIACWYRQNAILYVREDQVAKWPRLASLGANPRAPLLPLVHPVLFAEVTSRYERAANPGFRSALRCLPNALTRSLRRKLSAK